MEKKYYKIVYVSYGEKRVSWMATVELQVTYGNFWVEAPIG